MRFWPQFPRQMRSKKWRLAFQTFTETPATAPPTLGFGITHQPHEGGDGAKCGAKFADTSCITISKATSGCWSLELQQTRTVR